MKEEKFAILDKIKEIRNEENLQITLSIAISNEGNTNYEKYQSATDAMDIALGKWRPNCYKNRWKICILWRKSTRVRKRTKVKARVVAHALEELIQDASNVIIMGHLNGDIDSMGSSLGLYRFAKTLGKDAYVVNNTTGLSLNSFIETLQKQDKYKEILVDKSKALSLITEDSVLIITDTHKKVMWKFQSY